MSVASDKILFVFQDARFVPKWAMIPRDAFLKIPERLCDYEVLLANSENITETPEGNCVKRRAHLIVNEIIWSGNVGTNTRTPVSDITDHIQGYFDLEEEQYTKMTDNLWASDLDLGSCSSWDPIEAFWKIMERPTCEASEGFLVLERDVRESLEI